VHVVARVNLPRGKDSALALYLMPLPGKVGCTTALRVVVFAALLASGDAWQERIE